MSDQVAPKCYIYTQTQLFEVSIWGGFWRGFGRGFWGGFREVFGEVSKSELKEICQGQTRPEISSMNAERGERSEPSEAAVATTGRR